MLSFLPSWIIVFITVPLFFLNSAVIGTSIFLFGLVKLLLPIAPITVVVNFIINGLWRAWALFNLLITNLTNPVEWQIDGRDKFDKKGWYLLICNHISWVDIMVITQLALNRLPSPKFFLKDELKRMPFVGMAAWAMDMPFMKRYSRSYIEKHPEKKGQDILRTKKSCEKFKNIPTTIINFVEGTRCTEAKQQKTQSEFSHLLEPRAGGIAFTLSAMGHLFSGMLNVTLNYPDNKEPAKDILLGKMKRVQVKVELMEVTEQQTGDYFEDEEYKSSFQTWLNDLWRKKDKLLQQLNG
jgi:1-acyl-sn-glycerol-3-phosphate acyltransferase